MDDYASYKKLQTLEKVYLNKLYSECKRNGFNGVNINDFKKEFNLSDAEADEIFNFLLRKKLIELSTFQMMIVSALGVDKIEKEMAQSYEEKEYLVLRTLFEKNKDDVTATDLAKILPIPENDIYYILKDFTRKGWADEYFEDTARITDSGVTALHKWDKQGNSSVTSINHNTTNVHGSNYGNILTGGQGSFQSIQNTQVISNPDFNTAIETIIGLIKDSSLANFKKEDLISDIERIKQLAQNEPSPELVEHAKSKINYLETAIKATDLITKLSPYIPQLYAYFEGLLR